MRPMQLSRLRLTIMRAAPLPDRAALQRGEAVRIKNFANCLSPPPLASAANGDT